MTETLHEIEDEIKNSLLKEEKEEMITGGFKISIKEEGQIEVTELPPLNLKQLDLPLRHPEEFGKGNS
jgi:hypothetical protein